MRLQIKRSWTSWCDCKVGAAGSWLHLASYVLVHASKYHHFSSPSRCIQNIDTSNIRILFSKEMDRADINLIICNFPDDFAPRPLLQTVQFLFWMDLSGTLADFLRAWERKTSGISSKWMMDGSYLCVFIPQCKENEIFLLMQALCWYYHWESYRYLKIYRKCVKKIETSMKSRLGVTLTDPAHNRPLPTNLAKQNSGPPGTTGAGLPPGTSGAAATGWFSLDMRSLKIETKPMFDTPQGTPLIHCPVSTALFVDCINSVAAFLWPPMVM